MKHWRWLDDGILPFSLIFLRACWLWPWLVLLQSVLSPSAPNTLMPLWLIIGTPLLGLTLARYLTSEDSSANDQSTLGWQTRFLMAGTGLLAILLAIWWQCYQAEFSLINPAWFQRLGQDLIHWPDEIPAPLFVLLSTAFLWLGGLLDAAKRMSHDDIWRGFGIGFVALTLYLLLIAIGQIPLTNQVIYLLLLFFGVGMAALAFSSTKITAGLDRALGHSRSNPRAGSAGTINRYWLITVGTVIISLIGLGLLLGLLIAPDDIAQLWAMINSVLSAIWYLISQVILFVSYVLFMILYYIGLLLKPLFEGLVPEEEESAFEGLAEQERPPALEQVMTEPTAVPDAYRWAGLVALVIVMLLIFALALRQLRKREEEELDEVRESILSADLLQSQLAGLFKDLLGRARSAIVDPFLSLNNEDEARRIIRKLYQQLLSLGQSEEVQQPRLPQQTPYEYEKSLHDHVATDPLSTLTDHYMQARYGPDMPTAEDVEQSQEAWEKLQK